MKRLVIFGSRAFAQIAHFYFERDSDYTVEAFTVDGEYLKESTFQGLPVIPFEELGSRWGPGDCELFVAVGHHEMNQQRARKVEQVEAAGYRLASFVSSTAEVYPDLEIRPNVMIMERCMIQPFSSVGKDTIIWASTRLAFGANIGEHVWMLGSLQGESVTIGDNSFIGLGALLCPSITIGKRNLIGAGTLITKSTKDDEVYRGLAAKASSVPSHRMPGF